MTTFIKTKLKKSDDQTNIDKYRVVVNITEYHDIKINRPKNHHSEIVSEIIIPSLKSIENSNMPKLINHKAKNRYA